jgi:Ice-binding-like
MAVNGRNTAMAPGPRTHSLSVLRASAGAILATGFAAIVATLLATSAQAATAPGLGTAGSFVVLAGAGVTNTGPTTLNGDLGTFPTATVTGTSTLTLNGTNHAGDAVTQGAKNDLVTAYDSAAAQGPPAAISTDLGGQTLVAGVYNSASSIGLTGALTLDAQGNPNAVFVFQAGSTLTTASGSSVVLLNGAQACNIFWQVGSSATLGTGSTFRGSILALTDITVTTGATIEGRALARNGAVTLDTNTITRPVCASVSTATATTTATAPVVSPTSTASTSRRSSTPSARTSTPTPSPTITGETPLATIPRTGGSTSPLGALGLTLLTAGAGLLIATRRRRLPGKHAR